MTAAACASAIALLQAEVHIGPTSMAATSAHMASAFCSAAAARVQQQACLHRTLDSSTLKAKADCSIGLGACDGKSPGLLMASLLIWSTCIGLVVWLHGRQLQQ